jgi:hypothetical protein
MIKLSHLSFLCFVLICMLVSIIVSCDDKEDGDHNASECEPCNQESDCEAGLGCTKLEGHSCSVCAKVVSFCSGCGDGGNECCSATEEQVQECSFFCQMLEACNVDPQELGIISCVSDCNCCNVSQSLVECVIFKDECSQIHSCY